MHLLNQRSRSAERATTEGLQPAPHLLVLDDDVATGRLVGRIAASVGYRPTVTQTAEAFHAARAENPPDVIVLDLQLGTTDGVEQVRHLAAQEYRKSLVLISGFSTRILHTVQELAASLGLCVAGCFSKPLDVDELRQGLQQIRTATNDVSADRLRQALRRGEFVLEYQPIVATATRSVSRLEALVRWHHPRHWLIGPERFLPVFDDDDDLASMLTEWSFTQVVGDYRRLAEQGVSVPIAVNLPPNCVFDLAFPDVLERRLRLGGMPPDRLCLEITESRAFQDPVRSMDILSRIRLKGMHLAIDDFGTGYSSLKLLRQMPFSMIKIDRSFVMDMENSRDSRAIVTSVIDLAHNMDLACVAEGVETSRIAACLEALEVDFLQGYLIGRSMAPEHLAGWLPVWQRRAPAAWQADLNLAPDDAAALAEDTADDEPGVNALSPRQQAVMRLLAEGCSVKEMARRLGLGIGTVKTHVAQAYAALGAHNRIEALRLAGLSLSAPDGK